jgi:hypothetical protein
MALRLIVGTPLNELQTAADVLKKLENPEVLTDILVDVCNSEEYINVCGLTKFNAKVDFKSTIQGCSVAVHLTILAQQSGYFDTDGVTDKKWNDINQTCI